MPAQLITLLDGSNQPLGPFPLAEVQRRLQAGEFRPDQLAFADGLAQWTPLASVLAHVLNVSALPPYFPSPASTPPQFASLSALPPYAGFWLRAVAYLLDGLVIWSVFFVVFSALMLLTNPVGFLRDLGSNSNDAIDAAPIWLKLIILPLFIFGPILYFAFLESSPRQASLGKMALGLKVTDLSGQRLSFSHAFGRTAAKMITNMTCLLFYFGYILAGLTEKKQALHDMIASTLVWKK